MFNLSSPIQVSLCQITFKNKKNNQVFSHLKKLTRKYKKVNVNQSRRQREGFPSSGVLKFWCWMCVWRCFWDESKGLNVKKVWTLFSLGHFPKRPLRLSIFNPKTMVVSALHVPITSSQLFVGWVCLLVDIRHVF